MHIRKAIIRNYRVLRQLTVEFNEHTNVIVGDNETGKSTLLEAINLGLTGQIGGRPAQYEFDSFLFNLEAVNEYLQALRGGSPEPPPSICIELYFSESEELARLRGTNNSLKEDTPGVVYSIELDQNSQIDYAAYIADPSVVQTVPIELYASVWRGFDGNQVNARAISIKPAFIDASAQRQGYGAHRYLIEQLGNFVSSAERARLSLAYRRMKQVFMEDQTVREINEHLIRKTGEISDKPLSLSLDTTARGAWENSVVPHLDDIPLPLVGAGEQNAVKVKVAIGQASEKNVLLIEEAENHLSHSNLNRLIDAMSRAASSKQLLITTHSSFVLNKLGVENVLLFTGSGTLRLDQLQAGTHDYFQKLPGYNTLRMILASKVVLVEGPSDELIVQRAYMQVHAGRLPMHDGIDVISVHSLAFKRFLEIAAILGIDTTVVTDNDGDIQALENKYSPYRNSPNIRVCYEPNAALRTLEEQLLELNGRDNLDRIFGTRIGTNELMLKHMKDNKTDCALAIFSAPQEITYPENIITAVT